MNFLLCESHYRSRSWVKVLIQNRDLHILSVLTEELKLHLKLGINKNKICDLNPKNLSYNKSIPKIESFLKKFEKDYSINLNQIILMDRTLRTKTNTQALHYVYFVIKKELEFLTTKKIKLIF